MKTKEEILNEHMERWTHSNTLKTRPFVLEAMEAYAKEAQDICEKSDKRLQNGRDYLMQVESNKITVEDSLEAFGFGRNGLDDNIVNENNPYLLTGDELERTEKARKRL